MAYLGTQKLKELIKREEVIKPSKDERVICGAYELSLGSEVFRTDSSEKIKEFINPKEQVRINPGQFALLLTEETVNIPRDKIAFISIKASIKLRGLVNVSGFHVDPGFKGNLVFSVYNAGSSPISLLSGEPCFLIWFADLSLSENEITDYKSGSHEHKGLNTIPPKYIDALLAGELASPNVLLEKIKSNFSSLETKINLNNEAQNGKINLIERDQKANNYIAATALGLVVVVIVKFVFDWSAIKTGIDKGIEVKRKEQTIDSIINSQLLEKQRLMIEIDSMEKVRDSLKTSVLIPKNGNDSQNKPR
ncbi:MAG: deoxycytidine triphosphate deaminase [Flavobacterium sp.]|nr:MAG: deoxycytidine triphosphate deaminase [Flavobacterium sp.]